MPRYFLYLRDDTTEVRDDEGREFASLAEVEVHARAVVDEMIRNTTLRQNAGAMLVVVDAQGNAVLEIPLSENASFQPKTRPPLR
jgi:hypothetical protein